MASPFSRLERAVRVAGGVLEDVTLLEQRVSVVKHPGVAERIEFGQYIVADPAVCHGKLTFKGSRIMVWQLFEHLALGESLEDFAKQFPDRVSLEAAREALEIGQEFFADHADELREWAAVRSKG